jgi:8-oxo-dGTP diphosphatase
MSSNLLRRFADLITEANATVAGPFKLVSVQDGVATVVGHEPIRLGPNVRDTLRPGYNYAFELAGDVAHRVILLVVDIVVHTDTEVLMIKRKNNPYAGHWALPGGFIDPGETPMRAALRELVEETGVELSSAPELVGEFREPYRDPRMEHTWSWAYKLHVPDRSETTAGDDASAAVWIPIDQLSQLQLAFDHAAILNKALS